MRVVLYTIQWSPLGGTRGIVLFNFYWSHAELCLHLYLSPLSPPPHPPSPALSFPFLLTSLILSTSLFAGFSLTDSLHLFRSCSKSSACPEGVVCFELLDIFVSKGGYRDISGFSSSPPTFCGSPPSRAGNPLIHDAAFLHQRPTSNLSMQMNSCGPSSYSAKPTVRIEGFGAFGSEVSALA